MAYYGTVDGGDTYFSTKLHTDAWVNATDTMKIKALTTSTTMINHLNFEGSKTDPNQDLEFPRSDGTIIPDDIINATYELSLTILQEDPNEYDPRIKTARLGSASVTYDTFFEPEHISAGIPSKEAWAFLKPYLKANRNISLERID